MHRDSPAPAELPAYDVVIPTYRRASVVEQAIASVLAQSHRPGRIVVVDDGSGDGTAALLREIERHEPAVTAVLLPRNGGASAARNAGLALVRAPWVAFLDSDDRWLPGAAAALATAASSDVDVVVGCFRRAWPDGMVDAPECGWDGGCIRAALAQSGAIGPSWSMTRSDVARAVHGFDHSFHNCNDWDFYTRAAAASARFRRIDAAVALYHYGASGQLSHDREIGGTNAGRVLSHAYFAGAADAIRHGPVNENGVGIAVAG